MQHRILIRAIYIFIALLVSGALTGLALLLESKEFFFAHSHVVTETVEPFPVGVVMATKTIEEQPQVDQYFTNTFASTPDKHHWRDLVASLFSTKAWYQNLASPVQRIIVIWPGERREEVAAHFGDVLSWDQNERSLFVNLIQSSDPLLADGKFMPGRYTVHRDATPAEVADLVYEQFSTEILRRYTDSVEAATPIEITLNIAALIEREASDFENMREVSGVIWNRLFIDMPLQLDATLQYARGSRSYEPSWWPVPVPSDKFIDSPFNTYQNKGLPPAPIANPSKEAILAALNPRITDCLFYFHANNGEYYCSETYAEHVEKLKSVFGQGR